jgi:hypothetical protein
MEILIIVFHRMDQISHRADLLYLLGPLSEIPFQIFSIWRPSFGLNGPPLRGVHRNSLHSYWADQAHSTISRFALSLFRERVFPSWNPLGHALHRTIHGCEIVSTAAVAVTGEHPLLPLCSKMTRRMCVLGA